MRKLPKIPKKSVSSCDFFQPGQGDASCRSAFVRCLHENYKNFMFQEKETSGRPLPKPRHAKQQEAGYVVKNTDKHLHNIHLFYC